MHDLIQMLYYSNNTLFSTFSTPHWAVLSVPVIGTAYLLANRHRLVDSPFERRWKTVLLAAMLLQQFMLYSWYWFAGSFDLKDALPLYPCRISSLLCIILLLRMNRPLFNLLFFLGLPGATLAMLFPDTSHLGFPNAMFIQFFIGHSGILLTIAYLTLRHAYVPSKADLKQACLMTLVYLGVVMTVNLIVGGNYAYLHHKPEVAFLDVLPPYPYYVPIFIAFVFAIFGVLQTTCERIATFSDRLQMKSSSH